MFSLSALDNLDSAVLIKPDFFTDRPLGAASTDNVVSVVKGLSPVVLPNPLSVTLRPSDAKVYLLCFDSKKAQLKDLNLESFAVGFSTTESFTAKLRSDFLTQGISKVLAQTLPSESCPECIWQQSYLLGMTSNKDHLKDCWSKLLKKNTESDPPMALAKAIIGMNAVGINALTYINDPVSMSSKGQQNSLELLSITALSTSIRSNSNSDNHEIVLHFLKNQKGFLRASGLSAVSRFPVTTDLPLLAQMFGEDIDPMVQYGCLQNLATIYDIRSKIPPYDTFLRNKDTILAEWKKILQRPPDI